MTTLEPIRSLIDLHNRARRDEGYRRLAIAAAANLGGKPDCSLDEALRWLALTALETSEEGVVEEINFVRHCL